MKHGHHVPESCLRHCIEGISEVDVDVIDLLYLSVGFMRDKMYFLYVDVDTSTLPICVCVCIEREKERRETAGESQSHNHSDGVSESTNKRQEKTLKVIFNKKSLQAHLVDRLPLPHQWPHLEEIDQLLHVVTLET